jgi:hypothetical protein
MGTFYATFLSLSILTTLLALHLCPSTAADISYPDVPVANRPLNNFTFSPGTLIIPMANHQTENVNVPNKCVAGLFNLHVYGFLVRLLYANVPLYWAIRGNKEYNGVDFSAVVARVCSHITLETFFFFWLCHVRLNISPFSFSTD